MFSQFSTHPHIPRVCGKLPKVIIILQNFPRKATPENNIFRNCSKENLKISEKFQQNFGGSKNFSESQNCPNFKSCVGDEPPRSIFLPKKQPNSQNRRILKSACQSVTFALWACCEKFNINFLSQNFFLASPHVC